MQLGNRYWAYDNATGTCVSPEEGRKTEPDARVDAHLNFNWCVKASVTPIIWNGIDPVLQAKG